MHQHHWTARIVVTIIMLILASIGLILTDIQAKGGWHYWRVITVVFALLALSLSWYLRRSKQSLSLVTLWHEVLHWFFLILSTFIVSIFVHVGIMGSMAAALSVLALLSQSVFLAGVYIETTFLFIGIVLTLFTICVAFIQGYLYAVALPLLALIALAVIGFIVYLHHKKKKAGGP